ncbi:hypothetical protein TNCT_71041 [Trichonephila clavata]|uniref:Uncharacterized protein n=2 Tax=Trichonephila TaxID=2585208 RepID=A0A8X6HBS3_TRICU|nr:hypothetical protein TNCT_71041 [Trichonephila clavata]GFY61136.1 hypothetical protein TNIN_69781 [Trichonephila inaurata madagascariensis]
MIPSGAFPIALNLGEASQPRINSIEESNNPSKVPDQLKNLGEISFPGFFLLFSCSNFLDMTVAHHPRIFLAYLNPGNYTTESKPDSFFPFKRRKQFS